MATAATIEDRPPTAMALSPSIDPAWRSTNAGALLFAASTRAVAVKLAVIRAQGFTVTEAQLALFHALDADGTRLSELAARANLGKAAMVETVDRAVAAGLVGRRVDPADARARIVVPTVAGHDLRRALAAGLAAAERDVADVLGPGPVGEAAAAALRQRLGVYVATGRRLVPAGADAGWAAANVGRAVALAARRFVQDVAAAVAASGFDASEAVLGMIRHLGLAGTRLTDLAAAARTTKPAMAELVARAERLGHVARLPAADARARTIVFTEQGRGLLAAARDGVAAAEAAMAAVVGPTFAAIKADLACLAAAAPR